jgi:peptidoglycan/LPS O-acetylase OafA/YrhL
MIRSIMAVVLGYVVMLVAVLGGDTAMTALAPELMPQPGEPPDAVYFAFKLGTGFFFMMIGGYVTALLAGQSEMKHALGLGALSIAMGICEVLYFPGEQPLWYSIALMFLSIPSTLIGGYYRARQVQDGSAPAITAD